MFDEESCGILSVSYLVVYREVQGSLHLVLSCAHHVSSSTRITANSVQRVSASDRGRICAKMLPYSIVTIHHIREYSCLVPRQDFHTID